MAELNFFKKGGLFAQKELESCSYSMEYCSLKEYRFIARRLKNHRR